jgi:hypothetical protein
MVFMVSRDGSLEKHEWRLRNERLNAHPSTYQNVSNGINRSLVAIYSSAQPALDAASVPVKIDRHPNLNADAAIFVERPVHAVPSKLQVRTIHIVKYPFHSTDLEP